jgi:hypothetical protein
LEVRAGLEKDWRFFVKKYSLLLLLIIAFIIAACNGDGAEEETPARPTPTTEGINPTPPGGYPPEPTEPVTSGYPAEVTEAWMVIPAGKQCAESLAYPSAESAVAVLEQAGVTILAVEETELVVCEACDCPTSAHYRVLLAAEDFPAAMSLGWRPE